MTPQVVDAQRDVVKNEQRQSVENRMAWPTSARLPIRKATLTTGL
jgi:hypothetical protein